MSILGYPDKPVSSLQKDLLFKVIGVAEKQTRTSYQYKYDNMMRVNSIDFETASKIAKVVLDAYNTLTKIMG